jgi:hypothetical protein
MAVALQSRCKLLFFNVVRRAYSCGDVVLALGSRGQCLYQECTNRMKLDGELRGTTKYSPFLIYWPDKCDGSCVKAAGRYKASISAIAAIRPGFASTGSSTRRGSPSVFV